MTDTDTSPVLGTTKGDLEKLLEHVQLLGTDEDRQKLDERETKKWDGETPLSFQVIKSGATQVTRTWTKWARNAGGTVALLSVIGGGVGSLVEGLDVPVATALVAGGTVLLASIALSVAMIISADLRARSVATAARTEGRAAVTTKFLDLQEEPAQRRAIGSFDTAEIALLVAVASRWPVTVTTKEQPDTSLAIIGVKLTANGLRFVTATDVLGISEIRSWSTGG
jgi:hypothetical protein